MICTACRDAHHDECRGGSWCDCQHQPSAGPGTRDRRDGGAGDGDRAGGPTEPPVNWKRQG